MYNYSIFTLTDATFER